MYMYVVDLHNFLRQATWTGLLVPYSSVCGLVVHVVFTYTEPGAGRGQSCSHVPYWYNVDLPCHVFALLRSASVGPGTCVASSSPQIIYDFLELYFHRFLDSHN